MRGRGGREGFNQITKLCGNFSTLREVFYLNESVARGNALTAVDNREGRKRKGEVVSMERVVGSSLTKISRGGSTANFMKANNRRRKVQPDSLFQMKKNRGGGEGGWAMKV